MSHLKDEAMMLELFCWRTQVSQSGLEPTLSWSETSELSSPKCFKCLFNDEKSSNNSYLSPVLVQIFRYCIRLYIRLFLYCGTLLFDLYSHCSNIHTQIVEVLYTWIFLKICCLCIFNPCSICSWTIPYNRYAFKDFIVQNVSTCTLPVPVPNKLP